MQWVVTTGRTVELARARALDALGVDEADLEIEVLDEGRVSLFGLRTTEARVRARVKPTRPRPKMERRTRRPKGRRNQGGGKRRRGRNDRPDTDSTQDDDRDGAAAESGERSGGRRSRGRGRSGGGTRRPAPDAPDAPDEAAEPQDDALTSTPPVDPAPQPVAGSTSPADAGARSHTNETSRSRGSGGAAMSDIALSEQEPTAVDFVRGLVEAFGADAEVSVETTEDGEAIEIAVEGEDLGLLVGQKGATLSAIQELTRTAVAQQHAGRLEGRLRVDVAGYRARRTEALIRFAQKLAAQVIETGDRVALEPMSPPDRKVVHDAVNEIDGVYTSSEGEDRRRHVVIHPDS